MQSFEQFTEAKDSSSKIKAMTTLVHALKDVFGKYDLPTRRHIWEKLTSKRGQELVHKILRYPGTYLSDSEFRKLVD